MLRVLFVEDDETSIRSALRLIRQKDTRIKCFECEFHEFDQIVRESRPEIIVLDLWDGPPSEMINAGLEKLRYIWEKQFCPVIVYSAAPDLPEEYKNSYVREVKKGSGSEVQVLETIHEFQPQVEALKKTEEHIRNVFSIAMRDVAPTAFELFPEGDERDEAILRAGRRRLAALMDEESMEVQRLASWEQYLCPPISKYVMLGDILRETSEDSKYPTSFRVVLTPSCDLVFGETRDQKVDYILAAKCCSTKDGIDQTSWSGISSSKLKRRLIESALSQGYFETIMPLPKLQGRFPTMAVNLRKLELIPFSDVGSENDPFERIASLDSPFRELVSWAYLQVAGRPGVPDRDLESWRDEIIEAYNREVQ